MEVDGGISCQPLHSRGAFLRRALTTMPHALQGAAFVVCRLLNCLQQRLGISAASLNYQ